MAPPRTRPNDVAAIADLDVAIAGGGPVGLTLALALAQRGFRTGLVVSPVCFFAVSTLKKMLGYDDALDVFGVHCIGGIIGALGTGLAVNPDWGGAGVVDYVNCSKDGVVLATCPTAAYDMTAQMISQATGVVTTLVWSGGISLLIWIVLRVLGLLRVKAEVEEEGLDINEHGEVAYHT